MTRCDDASQRTASRVTARTAWLAIALVWFVFVVAGAPAARAGSNVWTSNGPGGVRIEALAIDPTTPSTLYAGTYPLEKGRSAGVFKSTDGGASWQPASTGLPQEDIEQVGALVLDPTAPSTLYAGTVYLGQRGLGGVFKSTDGAASWQVASRGLPNHKGRNIAALALDPTRPSTLYAGGYDGVFKSTDGAASWQPANSGLPDHAGGSALAIDPVRPSTLYYAGTDYESGLHGVFKSTDGAATWQPAATGLPGDRVEALAIDPAMPATLYVGTFAYFGSGGGGVFKSTDGAATWLPAATGLPEPDGAAVSALAINPTNPSILYAGTYPAYGSRTGGGVFESTDGAASWHPAPTGLPDNAGASVLAIDPATPTTLYAGTDSSAGTYSNERGLGGVFKSTDGGASWQPARRGLPGNTRISALAVDPTRPSFLYAGADLGYSENVFKSVDGSASWQPTTTDVLGFGPFTAFAIDPAAPSTLYAGAGDGVFKSTDGTASWERASTGLPDLITEFWPAVSVLAFDRDSPSTLYAATSTGVFKSRDGAASWQPATTGLPESPIRTLVLDPTTPATVYAGTYDSDGVFKSTDGAGSWHRASAGLPGNAGVSALAIDPTNPSTLYAGTYPPLRQPRRSLQEHGRCRQLAAGGQRVA